jgi:chromosome segregation ATPase
MSFGSLDYRRGREDNFFAQQRAARDLRNANDNLQEWKNYAAELERKLAQAQAETIAARIQRNTYSKQLDRLVGELAKVDPRNPAANSVGLIAEGRKAIDAELATHGLMIDRTDMNNQVVKRIR